MKPLAIITPWFGAQAQGGAERQAYQVALRLAARGHAVEVLTTCCRSFMDDWATDHFPAGASRERGFLVRRFPTDRRDRAAFERLNERLLAIPDRALRKGVSPLAPAAAEIFARENINSAALLAFLRAGREQYRAFIFLPYLYGTTLNGLPLVAGRAFLQPCLHDEAYARLPAVAGVFRSAKGLLFNSVGEARLAAQLHGPALLLKSAVVGEGIEWPAASAVPPAAALPASLRGARFVLALGRRDPTKNTPLLARAYARFRAQSPQSTLRLALAGPGGRAYASEAAPGLVDLGEVGEDAKEALLRACLALLQPSRHESFSRVIMEAWARARPVAAHRDCLATAVAVRQAAGGWLAGASEAEWAALFAEIDRAPAELLARLGERGRAYAQEHADWERAIERYEQVLKLNLDGSLAKEEGAPRLEAKEESARGPAPELNEGAPPAASAPLSRRAQPAARARRRLREIHQLLPDLAYADAISNQALAIRDRLRARGYASDIFVKNLHREMAGEGRVFAPDCLAPEAGLIYHHSIGAESAAHALAHRGPKCLVYHNITPARFFASSRPGFAWLLEQGRADLPRLALRFPLAYADSAYNAAELARLGFPQPGVLPIIVTPKRWDIAADSETLERLQDGKRNLIFVGRLAPNKRQDQLVAAFAHYRALDPQSRLLLIGDGKPFDPYAQRLKGSISQLGLSESVVVTGQVTDAQLLAYYRTAHLFWSLSEHEGFCVPIVEAMWCDVPVLAYAAAAVPETMGAAGLLFADKSDLRETARLADRLMRDEDLRERIIATQQARRAAFLPEAVWPKLEELIERLEELPAPAAAVPSPAT